VDARPGTKILFFDLLEVQQMDGLALKLNAVQKHPGNPVIGAGEEGDFDEDGAGHFLRVIKEDGRYRMWYTGMSTDPTDEDWWHWYNLGYAESDDGHRFEKVNLELGTFRGRPGKNLLPGLPYTSPMVLVDEREPDPNRRYKLLNFSHHGTQNDEARAGQFDLWSEAYNGSLLTSPDGIRWKREQATIEFPGGKPLSFTPQSIFYDERETDPNKRYKAYGYSSLNLTRRAASLAYSADTIDWTAYPGNPVLDPYARGIPVVRGGKVHQIHDTVVWPYHGYYLAFYQYQTRGDLLDIELAVSRDGENFVFVNPGEKLIPHGAPGEWDCDDLSPSTPFVDGEQIRLYYGGICFDAPGGETRSGGLGTLRLDGFTHLELEPGTRGGSVTTIPLEAGGASSLFLNAAASSEDYLEVELIDPKTGDPLDGFSRAECRAITQDAVRQEVHWEGREDLRALDKRSFQVRIYFMGTAGSPRLYSLSFE
jgi:hypothetical protein